MRKFVCTARVQGTRSLLYSYVFLTVYILDIGDFFFFSLPSFFSPSFALFIFFPLLVISVIIIISFSFGLLSVQWDIKGGNISGRICGARE